MIDKKLYDFAQGISDAIFETTGCHVTISNTDNIRIAGTGDFKKTLGKRFQNFLPLSLPEKRKKLL